MKVILLSAGFGTRLNPITSHIPKCLVPINGIPLQNIWLNKIECAGITDVLINTHYLAEQVLDNIKKYTGNLKIKIVHEDNLLGTGGSVVNCIDWIGNDDVMVIHADNLSAIKLENLMIAHAQKPKHCEITMVTFETDFPESCGIVEIKDDIVVKMHEKVKSPPGNLANAAIYILDNAVVEFMSSTGIHDISEQLIPGYYNRIYAYNCDCYHRDIGTLESYYAALEEVKNLDILW